MKIFVKGKQINLTQKDFVAKGGEGSIFQQSNVAYKIYEELKRMIPLAKIGELNKLARPEIIAPLDPLYNEHKHLIGFSMNWLGNDKIALCKLFTNKYRENNNIEPERINELVENIKNIIHFIHQNKCLIVDGNELNYLVSQDYVTPYFIDVNSWKTPSFEATAIMPSIRDWTTDKFSEVTDWFSFAIVAFQLFVGIHPFKGKHKGYKKNDFINRIKDGVSVFNSEVRIPQAARDFNLIPSAYKDWMFHMFEHGNRTPPPQLPGEMGKITVDVKIIQSTAHFEITELQEYKGKVLYYKSEFNIAKTSDHLYIGKTNYKAKDVEVLFTPLEQIPIMIKLEDNKVKFKAINYESPSMNLVATDKMIIDNILFLRNKDKLMEMDFKVMGSKIHPMIKRTWAIETNSSKLFGGVVYQSALGTSVLTIPLPTYTKSKCITKQIPELDEYRIIDARYENNVCILTGHRSSQYDTIIIIFDEKHENYRIRLIKDVDYESINFTTLDNGVCVMITEDAMEIFLNRIDKPDVKRIEDPIIDSTMRLCKDGTSLRFYRDNKLYSIKMI
jgi:hypothetical protein